MTNDPVIIGWAAGLFDGEGSIAVTNTTVKVAIEMTDLDILERMQANFGGNLVETAVRKQHYKRCWKWYISKTEDAQNFLKLIYSLLGLRRKAKCEEAFLVVPRRLRVSDTKLKVYALRDQNLTHQEIASRLGFDRSYISHILNGTK